MYFMSGIIPHQPWELCLQLLPNKMSFQKKFLDPLASHCYSIITIIIIHNIAIIKIDLLLTVLMYICTVAKYV